MVLELLRVEPIYPQYSGVLETCVALRYWFFEVLGSESVNMVTEKMDEFVIFSPKCLAEVCYCAQVLVKHSPTLGTLVSTKTKCIKLIFTGKITLVPVAFLMVLSINSSHFLFYILNSVNNETHGRNISLKKKRRSFFLNLINKGSEMLFHNVSKYILI